MSQGKNFADANAATSADDAEAPKGSTEGDAAGSTSDFAEGESNALGPAPKKVQPSIGGMFQGLLVINLDDEPDLPDPPHGEATSSQGMLTRRAKEAANPSSAPRAAGNEPKGKYNVTVPMQLVMTEETKKYYEKTGINEIQHAIMSSIKSLIDSKKKK